MFYALKGEKMKKTLRVRTCPYCGTPINEDTKTCPNCGTALKIRRIKKRMIIIPILIGVIIFVGLMSCSNKEKAELPPANTPIVYTVTELSTMFKNLNVDTLNAEKNYGNKYIEVTGKILSMDNSCISIGLNDKDYSRHSIICYIQNDEQLDYVTKKSVGDEVTIKGQITSVGETLNYNLNIYEIV